MTICTWSPEDNILSVYGDLFEKYYLNTGSEEINFTTTNHLIRYKSGEIDLQEAYWAIMKSWQLHFDNYPDELERMRKLDFDDPNNPYNQIVMEEI